MKILFINPPDDLRKILGEGINLIPVFEPLGILYIAAVCRKEGYDVAAIDAYAENLSEEKLKLKIQEIKPDIVGITTVTSNGGTVYELGKWLKENYPEVFVVLGNVHASVFAEAYLKNGCCDAVVHGEGEYTFLEIVKIREKKITDLSCIKSISYPKDGKIITTSSARVVENLTELPFPARELLKKELYNIQSITNSPYSNKNRGVGKHMITSRGCPNCCTFCVVHSDRIQRQNAVSRVVEELGLLENEYHANYVMFVDPLFISNKKRILDLCRTIKQRKLKLRWGCEAHVHFIDEELVKEMEGAGCFDMAFGIESGVQRLLNNIRKGITLEKVERAINIVKKNTKLKVSGLFILGLPDETYKDSLQTIEFAKRLPLDMAQFSILVPYPGSQIFNELREKNEIDTGLRSDGSVDISAWLRYSGYISYTKNQPIWVTPSLTADTLKALQKRALRDFYFRPKQFIYQLKRVRPSELNTIAKTFWHTFF
jgi:radical SAM superfamily enzyme YgiQ (UPF0313 family)